MVTAVEWFGLGEARADDATGVPAGTPGEGSGNNAPGERRG
jgi:hypothetical protein